MFASIHSIFTCLSSPLCNQKTRRFSELAVYPEAVVRSCSVKNSQENTCASLFFIKVAGFRCATWLKRRLWHRCFTVNFAKFFGALFPKEHLRFCLSLANEGHSTYVSLIKICKIETQLDLLKQNSFCLKIFIFQHMYPLPRPHYFISYRSAKYTYFSIMAIHL